MNNNFMDGPNNINLETSNNWGQPPPYSQVLNSSPPNNLPKNTNMIDALGDFNQKLLSHKDSLVFDNNGQLAGYKKPVPPVTRQFAKKREEIIQNNNSDFLSFKIDSNISSPLMPLENTSKASSDLKLTSINPILANKSTLDADTLLPPLDNNHQPLGDFEYPSLENLTPYPNQCEPQNTSQKEQIPQNIVKITSEIDAGKIDGKSKSYPKNLDNMNASNNNNLLKNFTDNNNQTPNQTNILMDKTWSNTFRNNSSLPNIPLRTHLPNNELSPTRRHTINKPDDSQLFFSYSKQSSSTLPNQNTAPQMSSQINTQPNSQILNQQFAQQVLAQQMNLQMINQQLNEQLIKQQMENPSLYQSGVYGINQINPFVPIINPVLLAAASSNPELMGSLNNQLALLSLSGNQMMYNSLNNPLLYSSFATQPGATPEIPPIVFNPLQVFGTMRRTNNEYLANFAQANANQMLNNTPTPVLSENNNQAVNLGQPVPKANINKAPSCSANSNSFVDTSKSDSEGIYSQADESPIIPPNRPSIPPSANIADSNTNNFKNNNILQASDINSRDKNKYEITLTRNDLKTQVFGIKVVDVNGEKYISYIKQNSLVGSSSIRIGDHIISLNGIFISDMKLSKVESMITKSKSICFLVESNPQWLTISFIKKSTKRTGIKFKNGIISHVSSKSEAAKLGFLPNYRIMSINGMNTFSMKDSQIQKLMQDSYQLVINLLPAIYTA